MTQSTIETAISKVIGDYSIQKLSIVKTENNVFSFEVNFEFHDKKYVINVGEKVSQFKMFVQNEIHAIDQKIEKSFEKMLAFIKSKIGGAEDNFLYELKQIETSIYRIH